MCVCVEARRVHGNPLVRHQLVDVHSSWLSHGQSASVGGVTLDGQSPHDLLLTAARLCVVTLLTLLSPLLVLH